MSGFLIAVLSVGVILGFMILIHEFGHYATAKLLGVRVEVFSIGFGKRLFGFRRGDTDYRIAAIPLGGYVKMSGENPMDARTNDPGEFMSHPRWHRFIIAIAGPAMNILFAVESEFDISIPDEQAAAIKSVREMVEGIEKLVAAKEAAPLG